MDVERAQLLRLSSASLGLMGWAGWLGRGEQEELEAREATVRLGLGADYIEDATNWELSFFKSQRRSCCQRSVGS